jgi:PKD repeat protein
VSPLCRAPKQRSHLALSIRVLLLLLTSIRCSDEPLGPDTAHAPVPPRLDVTTTDPTSTIFAAGDIADCGRTQDNATGALIQSRLAAYPNAVVTPLGDNAYKYGRPIDYANCYDPAWGSFKAITRPVIGNHEYDSSATAVGYAGYFGAAVGPNPGYYYSYDIGTWHIVVLNTYSPRVSTKPTSAQDNWLIADLAANTKPCILGLMHHPRFFSVTNDTVIPPLEGFTSTPWQRLYAAGADLILTGHAHGYERYVPLTPTGEVDLQNGIREIIVGTGGEAQGIYQKINPMSEVQAPYNTYGVLQLSLLENRYVAKFLATSGGFTDSVSVPNCHRAPPPAQNSPPTAAFTASCTDLSCAFTDTSTDSDGIITSSTWDYGDGSTGSAAAHTYTAGGTFVVKLTVTDDDGASGTASRNVTVSPPNSSPTASFTWSCTSLTCTFVDGSSDSDGLIASRSWTFGDGTSSSAVNPAKTYSATGTYTVQLTVTDDRGATGSTTKAVTVSAVAVNSPPKALFGTSCTRLVCQFTDRSTDVDGNGTIVKWAWAFGDGKTFTTTTFTARNPSYTYAAGGTYKPTLTVTDNKGASGTIVRNIIVKR